jgi:type IV pilus assembly protein PilE
MRSRVLFRIRARDQGFTLIELMAVVVVIAILALIALPTYTDNVRRSRRADAITELNRVAQAQERWRSNNPNYNSADVSSAATGLRLVGGTTVSTSYTLPSGHYGVSIGTTVSPSNYMATATAAGAQAGDTNCLVLRLVYANGTFENWAGPSVAGLQNAASNANARRCWGR